MCSVCHGHGGCPVCNDGRTYFECPDCQGSGYDDEVGECKHCDGTGQIEPDPDDYILDKDDFE